MKITDNKYHLFDEIIFEKDNIFKYGKHEHVKETLESKTLKCSTFEEYNDPFEKIFYSNHFDTEKARDASNDAIKMNLIFNKELDKYFCICFSRTPYEPLMWSHYAEHHEGVCYCFANNIFAQYIYWASPSYLENVIYSTELPVIDFCFNQTSKDLLNSALQRVVLTKSHHWSYEQEKRFFTTDHSVIKHDKNNKIHYLGYILHSLQAIIIGSEMKPKKRKEIYTLVSAFNANNKAKVKILHATKSSQAYKIKITPGFSPTWNSFQCPKPISPSPISRKVLESG